MKKFLALFLLIGSTSCYSQEKEYLNSNAIKISLLRFIDPITPGLELSYTKRYLKKFGTELTVAYLTEILNLTDKQFYNYKGFRVSIEEKYFFNERRKLSWYIALNYAFVKNSYIDVVTFGGFLDGYEDEILIKKETHAINIKPGFNLYVGHFTMDISFGGGIKFRNVKHYKVDYPNQTFPQGFLFPDAYYYADDKERKVNISVAVSIKMGYWF